MPFKLINNDEHLIIISWKIWNDVLNYINHNDLKIVMFKREHLKWTIPIKMILKL